MKEGAAMGAAGSPQSQGRRVGSGGGIRSEIEKEKTKLRERRRRAITTNIFHGLRKHGGYRLSPRADINEVLRELAREAGWIIEPDGTTYRSASASALNICGACSTVGSATHTSTPDTSIVMSGGGECSTTTSPRHLPVSVGDYSTIISSVSGSTTSFFVSAGIGVGGCGGVPSSDLIPDVNCDSPLAAYMYGRVQASDSAAAVGVTTGYNQQTHEAKASNQNTPVGSPLPRS